MRFAFLHRPADLRDGRRDPHHADRRRRLFRPAGRAISGDRAADHRGHARPIPAPRPRSSARPSPTPLEQEINGVENMLYMVSQATGDGTLTLIVTFELGTDLDIAQVLVQNRVAIAVPRLPDQARADRRHGAQELARPADGDPPQLARRLARPALHLELRDPADPGRAGAARRRRRRARVRRARLCDAHLARPGQGRGARPDRGRRRRGAAGQNVQVASGVLDQPPMPDQGAFQLNVETLGRLNDAAAVRQHRRQDRAGRPGHASARRRRGSSSAPRTTAPTAISTGGRRCRS